MKSKTKQAAEAIRQALLSFPDKDLVEIIDYWFDLANLDGDLEMELRAAAGYQLLEDEECLEYVKPTSEVLRKRISERPIQNFAHELGSLPYYAGLLDASPLDSKKMLAAEHELATKLAEIAAKSKRPFVLAKIIIKPKD